MQEKEAEFQRHKVFSKFLDSIVNNKSFEGDGFIDVNDVQNRFQSLKNENKDLLQRKKEIERKQREAKEEEQKRLTELKNVLYEQQRNL